MTKKTRRGGRPWWRRRRTLQPLAVVAVAAVAIGAIAWLVVGGENGSGTVEYLEEAAPPFTLPTLTGDEVSLSDHLGRHNVLLFFNEGVGCAPCYQQIVDLEDDWDRFQALDVVLVSIMVDPVSELAPEASLFGVTGEKSIVAVDVDKSVSNAYDAMQASMHPGIKPGHTFLLVNKAGQIIWRWDWSHGAMYVEVDEIYGNVSQWLERRGGEQPPS